MKQVILRLGMYIGLMLVLVFASVFVWANWTPLSPGERQEPVNFVTYDVSSLNNNTKASQIASFIKNIEGVGGTNNVPALQSIIVIYRVLDITEKDILDAVESNFHYKLKHKQYADNGKRCPVAGSLSTMSRIRKALNIRG